MTFRRSRARPSGPLRIGIIADAAGNRAKTGIEHYAKHLILHLSRIDRTNRYMLYLRHPPEPWMLTLPSTFRVKVLTFPLLWTQLRISWELLWHPVDVLFVPVQRLPLVHPRRTVVTLHDLNFVHDPATDTAFGHRYLQWSTRRIAKAAWRIIAVSETTKQDLADSFPTVRDKATVIYHGYDCVTEPVALTPALAQKIGEHYVLYLSTVQPRKNVSRLIDAFVALKKLRPDLPHKLVIAGKMGWKQQSIEAKLARYREDVVYLGYVEDVDRWSLYRSADLFVLPSLHEGFGLGVLEAFQCGVPSALSSAPSLPEIAGDAALYFDPYDTDDICTALLRGLTDRALRRELVARGVRRLAHFSWERCARETLSQLCDSG